MRIAAWLKIPLAVFAIGAACRCKSVGVSLLATSVVINTCGIFGAAFLRDYMLQHEHVPNLMIVIDHFSSLSVPVTLAGWIVLALKRKPKAG